MIRALKFLPLALFILAMLVVVWIAQLLGAPDPFAESEDEPEAAPLSDWNGLKLLHLADDIQ